MSADAASSPVHLEDEYLDEQSRLEKLLGPEWARLLKGIVTNPLSVAGLIILSCFVLVALFAPILAPPINANWNTTLIPRDGFIAQPKPPGTPWERNKPETIPFWYGITGHDDWVHLFGTTSGQDRKSVV